MLGFLGFALSAKSRRKIFESFISESATKNKTCYLVSDFYKGTRVGHIVSFTEFVDIS